MDAMAEAVDIARYLIKLAAAEPEPEYLSHMRLQKLLYYVQGYGHWQPPVNPLSTAR